MLWIAGRSAGPIAGNMPAWGTMKRDARLAQ